ncbi:type II secretion system protein G [Parelusimicrobium proximum]|uniref:type IV pilin protein n=1 Tax=Parelusimicrobium proximum TaxID=3228953 RepID=UPI003D182606
MEKDSAPTIRKRSSRRDDLNKSSLLRTPSSSLPIYSVGFTLIELLVVVLIIAILAAVALPQYTKAVEKSRATEALLNIKAISGALERYKLAHDEYPMSLDALDISYAQSGKFTYTYYQPGKDEVVHVFAKKAKPGYDIVYFGDWSAQPAFSNKIACRGFDAKGTDVCRAFGTGTAPYFGSEDQTITVL